MNTNNIIKLAIAIVSMLCCNSTLMGVHATLCNVNGKTKYLYMATYDILFVYIYVASIRLQSSDSVNYFYY